MLKRNHFFLLLLSLYAHIHLHAAQMNVEVKEQEEQIELTAQEQAALDRMFEIIDATNKGNAAQQTQALQKLLQRYPRIVDAKSYHGRTRYHGWTPLMLAAHRGHAEIIKLLIAVGAQIDAQDNDGWTPLMYASCNDHAEIVKLLIAAGAQIDAQDNDGDTARDAAISYNHEKIYDNAVTAGLAERHRYLQAQQVAKKELEQHMIPELAKITAEYAYNPRVPKDLPEKQPSWWDKTKKLASKWYRGKQ